MHIMHICVSTFVSLSTLLSYVLIDESVYLSIHLCINIAVVDTSYAHVVLNLYIQFVSHIRSS